MGILLVYIYGSSFYKKSLLIASIFLYLNDIFSTAVLALDFAKIRNLTSVHVNESMCRTILVILSLLAFLSVLTDSDSESSSPL